MTEVDGCERRFVECFILAEKRERYLLFLKGPKHRQKVLTRLNHLLDFDPAFARPLPSHANTVSGLVDLLRRLHVAPTCRLMADANPLDGRELRLEHGVEALLESHWGAVLICPPKPIALYKEEDIGRLLLLTKDAGPGRE